VFVFGLLLYLMVLCIIRSRRDLIGFLSAMFGLLQRFGSRWALQLG